MLTVCVSESTHLPSKFFSLLGLVKLSFENVCPFPHSSYSITYIFVIRFSYAICFHLMVINGTFPLAL